jgi:hypothetical protein
MTHIAPHNWFDQTPDSAFLRERQLIGDRKNPLSPKLLPISHATLWRLVKAKQFPSPQKIGPNTTAWNAGSVRDWLNAQNKSSAKGVL